MVHRGPTPLSPSRRCGSGSLPDEIPDTPASWRIGAWIVLESRGAKRPHRPAGTSCAIRRKNAPAARIGLDVGRPREPDDLPRRDALDDPLFIAPAPEGELPSLRKERQVVVSDGRLSQIPPGLCESDEPLV